MNDYAGSPDRPETPSDGSPHQDSRRPRTAPIVWGALILVFCAYMLQQTLAPESVDSTTWAITSVIGLGVLLLVVGIAVIVRGRR